MTNAHRRSLASAALAVTGCLLLAACSSSAPAAMADAPAVPTTAGATPATSVVPTPATSAVATPTAAPTAAPTAGTPAACTLVTKQDVGTALGTDLGAGREFTSHGASQCQYGTYATAFVLVNVNPVRGKAAYDLMHSKSNLGHGIVVADVAGLGDKAFEISGPNTASIYFEKGDVLVLVMVEMRAAAAPPHSRVRALAEKAANRF